MPKPRIAEIHAAVANMKMPEEVNGTIILKAPVAKVRIEDHAMLGPQLIGSGSEELDNVELIVSKSKFVGCDMINIYINGEFKTGGALLRNMPECIGPRDDSGKRSFYFPIVTEWD